MNRVDVNLAGITPRNWRAFCKLIHEADNVPFWFKPTLSLFATKNHREAMVLSRMLSQIMYCRHKEFTDLIHPDERRRQAAKCLRPADNGKAFLAKLRKQLRGDDHGK